LDFETDEIKFDLDTAIPLGLIVNEVMTNALKHGLKNENNGRITVRFSKNKNGEIELKIGDNGKGVAHNPLVQKDETLGIMLITNLVDQIGATITYLADMPGTNYLIVIPTE
jgi:two-component sensor histidine kinase